MKFVVSSSELLGRLQSVSRVIASKNTLPILDNFLFELTGDLLTITASDLETTLRTSIKLNQVVEEGSVAIPARILTVKKSSRNNRSILHSIKNRTLLNLHGLQENFKYPRSRRRLS